MSTPAVSIVIPAYNAAAVIERALDSIVHQTFRDWEIVVVDDGSTDGTAGVVQRWRAAHQVRLTCVTQDNAGSSAARNTGIEWSRAPFVALLDADDEFLPHKLQRQLELFERSPELGLVFSDYAYLDLEGVYHPSRLADLAEIGRAIPSRTIAPALHVCTPDAFDCMLGKHFVSPITAVVRREVLSDEVRFPVGQDYWEEWIFFLEVAARTSIGYVAEALSVNHFVTGSLSRTDPMRNHAERVRALEHIRSRFTQASPLARAELGTQLSAGYRQLGCDHFRQADYRQAAGDFRHAFRISRSWRDALHWMQAAVADRRNRASRV